MADRDIPYPHLTTNPQIRSGVPIIEGTSVPVRSIAGYYQMGMTVDEILISLPFLTPGEVHSALAYYFDHQQEIDADIALNSDYDYWKAYVAKHTGAVSVDEDKTPSR